MDIKEFNEHLREAERLLKEVTRLQDELWAKEIARQASKRSSDPINSGRMMPWDGPYRATCTNTSFGDPIKDYDSFGKKLKAYQAKARIQSRLHTMGYGVTSTDEQVIRS